MRFIWLCTNHAEKREVEMVERVVEREVGRGDTEMEERCAMRKPLTTAAN